MTSFDRPWERFGLRVLGVSEVTRAIREAIRADERLRDVWVEGEVGRVSISSAGHAYFALTDGQSQISCVFFRNERSQSPFDPKSGMRMVVRGRIDLFEAQGVYQLYVSALQPSGFGELAMRFEALKAKLAAEGLFEATRKRPLPVRPAVIGVVTSPTGAVWHDIRHVIERRWPIARLVLSPCLVQGDAAPASIVGALDVLARYGAQCVLEGRVEDAPSVVLVCRGGGSPEDLWAFNDERVVRAVAAFPVPVVSGVGHEVDITLCDFAADLRAPTPSAAAELVVPDRRELLTVLEHAERRMTRHVRDQVAAQARELAAERRALDRLRPEHQVAQARERAGMLLDRAGRAVLAAVAERERATERAWHALAPVGPAAVARRRAALDRAGASLMALGPQATLERGYAIVRRAPDGAIVREPSQAPPGTRLEIRVAHGSVAAEAIRAGEAGPATVDGDEGGPKGDG